MSPDDKAIYEYNASYSKVQLFSNRLVIYKPGTFNVINEQIIPIRSITNIKIQGLTKVPEISTVDGKTHKLDFVMGEHSIKLRDELLKLI